MDVMMLLLNDGCVSDEMCEVLLLNVKIMWCKVVMLVWSVMKIVLVLVGGFFW